MCFIKGLDFDFDWSLNMAISGLFKLLTGSLLGCRWLSGFWNCLDPSSDHNSSIDG